MKTLSHFSIKTFLATTAFTILGMTAVNTYAATVNYFLQIDGIDGESMVKGHEKWIDINSFAWGASNSGGGSSGGGSTGKATFTPFSWMQMMDKSVPSLFTGLVAGKHFKTATLDAIKAGKSSPAVFFQMKFDNVLLTKLNISGGGGSIPDVAGAFDSFTKITMTYRQQLASGAYGPAIIGGWDMGSGPAPAFFGSPQVLEGLFLSQPASPVPVPGAAWLFGSGLLGMMSVARRKAV